MQLLIEVSQLQLLNAAAAKLLKEKIRCFLKNECFFFPFDLGPVSSPSSLSTSTARSKGAFHVHTDFVEDTY